jgi:hypothetical protein
MLPLECHTVARIQCDAYAIKSQPPRDLQVTEQTPVAPVRLAARSLQRAALGLYALLCAPREVAAKP